MEGWVRQFMTAEKASTIFDRSVGWLLTATGMFLHYQPSEFNSWRRFYLKGVHPWFYIQECLWVNRPPLEGFPCPAQIKDTFALSRFSVHSFICLMLLNRICVCVCLNDNKCDTDIALSLSLISGSFFFLAANHLCERKAGSIRKVLPEQQRLHWFSW